MSWITILFYNIILNSIVGAAAFGIWYVLGKIWERTGQYTYLYTCLRAVIFLFLLPFSWIYLLLISYEWSTGLVINLFPYTSPGMEKITFWVLLMWLPGAAVQTIRYLKEKDALYRIRKTASFVRDGEEWERFLELKKALGLKCMVELYRGKSVPVPMTAGMIRKRIYLPEKAYEVQEWEMIVLHELQHIRQKDDWMKTLCVLIQIIFWFHPVAYLLFRRLDSWGEISCDLQTCKAGKDRWTVQEYYRLIWKQVEELQINKKRFGLSLCESEGDLKWRILKMKNYLEKRQFYKKAGAVLAVLFFISSPILVMASGKKMGNVYYHMVDSTLNSIEYPYTPTVYEEHYEKADPEEVVEIIPVDVSKASNTMNIEFSGNGVKGTPYVSLEAGGEVKLSAFVTPVEGTVRIGVMNRNGDKQFVEIVGDGGHRFSVVRDGSYRFYVENVSGKSLTVDFTYTY